MSPRTPFPGRSSSITAIKIWCATWLSPFINSTDVPGTSTTADEVDLFPRFVFNGSGFFRTVAIQAAFVISAELIAQLQEDQGLGPTPLRRDLLSVTEEAKTWHLRTIRSGETSAKGHLLASWMAAQLEGLRRGLDRDQLGRFLAEAAEKAGETCLPILEGLEKATRGGDIRQGVEGTFPPVEGRSESLPDLTGEWDFTVSRLDPKSWAHTKLTFNRCQTLSSLTATGVQTGALA